MANTNIMVSITPIIYNNNENGDESITAIIP